MSLTFELSVFCILAAAMVASWVDVRVSAGKLEQRVNDHHTDSAEARKDIRAKIESQDKEFHGCQITCGRDMQSMAGKLEISEIHYQETKTMMIKLESKIDALHSRLDSFLNSGLLVTGGETGATGAKGSKGEKKD